MQMTGNDGVRRPGSRAVCAIVMLTLSLVVSACGGSNDGRPVGATEDAVLRVGYFEGWPLPGLIDVAGAPLEVLGEVPVRWVEMSSGGAMAIALHQGEIDIGFSHGLAAFARFVTKGFEIEAVGIAVDYSAVNDCLSHPGILTGPDPVVTKDNAERLLGGRPVYAPYGGMDHYRVAAILDEMGIEPATIPFYWSTGSVDAHRAFNQGDVVVACAAGDHLQEMRTGGGSTLLERGEQDDLGLRVVDLVTVSKAFVDRDLDVVRKFLTHLEVSNRRYLESPEKLLGAVSSAAGMDPDEARLLLEGFQFPSLAEQASEHWLGGSIQVLMKQFMDFLVAWDIVPVALESYEPFANPSLLNAVD